MITKIALGTVQFGQDYGIANTGGKVSQEEAFKILDYAKLSGIPCLDTALAYGDSENVIGEYLRRNPNDFQIVSKLPPIEKFDPGIAEESLRKSLDRIGIKKIYSYLIHRFSDILENDDLWGQLVRLKDGGQVEKVGFSLYSPDELAFLLQKGWDFDLVQIPYSIFDRRFEEYFDILRIKGIEIQVRSVFLQGLVFLNLEDLPGSLQAARPQLEQLRQISVARKIPVEALCLNFALLNPKVGRVLIGVDSLMHLKNNVACIALEDRVRGVIGQLREIRIDQDDILLPSKWNTSKVQT